MAKRPETAQVTVHRIHRQPFGAQRTAKIIHHGGGYICPLQRSAFPKTVQPVANHAVEISRTIFSRLPLPSDLKVHVNENVLCHISYIIIEKTNVQQVIRCGKFTKSQ